MIDLTKLSGEKIIINDNMIELIEFIPESKLVMSNGTFYIVKENIDVILEKIIKYQKQIFTTDKIVQQKK